jgi:hypothetical protein
MQLQQQIPFGDDNKKSKSKATATAGQRQWGTAVAASDNDS